MLEHRQWSPPFFWRRRDRPVRSSHRLPASEDNGHGHFRLNPGIGAGIFPGGLFNRAIQGKVFALKKAG
jgi:hypothetical protein